MSQGEHFVQAVMIFLLVWFGFFLNHELAYCLKVLITPEVQNKGSGLSYSHKCRCEGIEKWSELIFIFLGQ